jgi:Fe-S cluster assembly iron-binding protein IscA
MLNVTDRAISLLKLATSSDGEPDGAVRIERARPANDGGGSSGIGVCIVDEPEDGDVKLERKGLRIFIEESLVESLEDKTLDVRDGGKQGPLLVFS